MAEGRDEQGLQQLNRELDPKTIRQKIKVQERRRAARLASKREMAEVIAQVEAQKKEEEKPEDELPSGVFSLMNMMRIPQDGR